MNTRTTTKPQIAARGHLHDPDRSTAGARVTDRVSAFRDQFTRHMQTTLDGVNRRQPEGFTRRLVGRRV